MNHTLSFPMMSSKFQQTQNPLKMTIWGESKGQLCVLTVKNIIQQHYDSLNF